MIGALAQAAEANDSNTVIALSVIKLITIVLGFVIVYLGTKAYRNTRRKPLLWLTVGMAVMTLGAITEGAVYQGYGSLDLAHLVEAVITLIAFGVLIYSLYS